MFINKNSSNASLFVHAEEPYTLLQGFKMAALKFTGFIFLVYFTVYANAGQGRFCKKADQKLADLKTLVGNIDCSGQGTKHVFSVSIFFLRQVDSFSFFVDAQCVLTKITNLNSSLVVFYSLIERVSLERQNNS